ncbi:hypothetical protein G6O69_16185 [Pseudenhygromyxa sp. WMMC2535]|uniref:hypothetical protein n=1 Tax=Pseudenhygromyxa sp. WMMC2535 TaxID=2712867 RepID=UPI0015529F66|nr:hypothetical protein [Pseudenhygromyxa sp. WMMC2535]NVB39382.1 hypothetical protein [Pseudenhygromyxa sp. WMMC2535]
MNNALDIGATLNQAWEVFSKNAAAFILGFLLVGLVGAVTLGICLGPLLVGFNRMVLRALRGEKVEAGQVFAGFDMFGPAFVLMLLVGLTVFAGLLLFFIPGLIAGYLLFWSLWFMADGEQSAVECMKKSSALARADIGGGLIFVIVNGVIQSAGNVVPFGGLLTAPLAITMAGSGFSRAVHGMQPQPVDAYGAPQPGQMNIQQPYGAPQPGQMHTQQPYTPPGQMQQPYGAPPPGQLQQPGQVQQPYGAPQPPAPTNPYDLPPQA